MNPEAMVPQTHAELRRYVNAVVKVRQHPMKTAEMAQLLIHRAHPLRIKAAWDPWMESQREIGDAFDSKELGEAFVTHVQTAVEVIFAAQQLANDGLVFRAKMLDAVMTPLGGLLRTEEEKRAVAKLAADVRNDSALKYSLNHLLGWLRKLYMTEGVKMARIITELAGGAIPFEVVSEHLNTHLYHLMKQATHLLESQVAMDEDRPDAEEIEDHERSAREWLDRDVRHMTEFAMLLAPVAAAQAE